METKHLLLKEATQKEVFEYFDQVVPFSNYWLIETKEESMVAGYASLKEVEQSVVEVEILMKDYEGMADEVMESLLNHCFYKMRARKAQVPCRNESELDMMNHFGFSLDVSKANGKECFTLYKEEYLRWLRKRGKTLGFLKAAELRIVFVFVAMLGLLLFGMDMVRQVNDLKTVFYTYITGIGVAGAFACSWMLAKEKDKK